MRTYSACKMFPALNPLEIRRTKASEVFTLFRRIDYLNYEIEKMKNKNQLPSGKPAQQKAIDVTGQNSSWF